MTDQDLALSTRDLTKTFGAKTAVDKLNLSIERGEVFGLVGPNGAGKSTTMRLLIDVLRPSSGEMSIFGQNPRGNAALRQRIGYLPGEFLTVPSLTGRGLLKHFAALNPVTDPTYLDTLIDRLGAELTRPISKLSKGNKQKIGLIQAFMHRPDLLILDEPTSGLDPLVQQVFLQLVTEAADNGQTVFLSSHILSEIQHAAHRVGIVKAGLLLSTSTVAQLRDAAGQQLRAVLAGAQAGQLEAELSSALPTSRLAVTQRGETVSLTGTLYDPVAHLLTALTPYRVQEFSLEKPDLEESILHFYRDEEATERGSRAL